MQHFQADGCLQRNHCVLNQGRGARAKLIRAGNVGAEKKDRGFVRGLG